MTQQHVVIIGGGLAGLSAGCHARTSGFRATILEHNVALGGVCTAWPRGDYTVDGCIHWLTGGPFARLYDELHITPRVAVRPLEQFLTYIDEATGDRVEIARDPARLREQLRSIAPHDGGAIDDLLAGARQLADLEPPIDHPSELATITTRLRDLWAIRHQIATLAHFRVTVAEWCSANVQSGALRMLLGCLAGDDAPMLVVLMILGYLGRGWLSRPVGGTAAFRDALIDRYASLGGEARLHTTVEEILVADDRARGVRLTDGTTIAADAVVSTASSPETVLRLLGGRYGAPALRERLETWPTFDPIALVTYGVAAPLAHLPPTMILNGVAGLEVGGRHNGHFYVRIYNEGPGFAPPGHSVVQVMLQTSYDWWATRGARYASEKDMLGNTLLAQLQRYLPAMAGAVRMVDVATPLTYWRQARSWRGAYEGWKPTQASLLGHVDKTLPGLAGLYLAGQWVEPGGGVPAALMSGRQAIQILCHDAGRPFVVPTPEVGSSTHAGGDPRAAVSPP
jgi:phytoene desaturase